MFKGTHGTCYSNAESIRNNGFRYSKMNLRGGGIYFWGYILDDLEVYAKDLAIAWWRFAKKRGDVEKSMGKSFKMIHVKVQAPKTYNKVLPMDLTGQPSCYVIKNLDCIDITRFEEFDYE